MTIRKLERKEWKDYFDSISKQLPPSVKRGRDRQLRCLLLDEMGLFRPPAPVPRAELSGPLALLKALWNNPVEAWTQQHCEQPIVVTNLAFGEVAVVSEPAAIRRV